MPSFSIRCLKGPSSSPTPLVLWSLEFLYLGFSKDKSERKSGCCALQAIGRGCGGQTFSQLLLILAACLTPALTPVPDTQCPWSLSFRGEESFIFSSHFACVYSSFGAYLLKRYWSTFSLSVSWTMVQVGYVSYFHQNRRIWKKDGDSVCFSLVFYDNFWEENNRRVSFLTIKIKEVNLKSLLFSYLYVYVHGFWLWV